MEDTRFVLNEKIIREKETLTPLDIQKINKTSVESSCVGVWCWLADRGVYLGYGLKWEDWSSITDYERFFNDPERSPFDAFYLVPRDTEANKIGFIAFRMKPEPLPMFIDTEKLLIPRNGMLDPVGGLCVYILGNYSAKPRFYTEIPEKKLLEMIGNTQVFASGKNRRDERPEVASYRKYQKFYSTPTSGDKPSITPEQRMKRVLKFLGKKRSINIKNYMFYAKQGTTITKRRYGPELTNYIIANPDVYCDHIHNYGRLKTILRNNHLANFGYVDHYTSFTDDISGHHPRFANNRTIKSRIVREKSNHNRTLLHIFLDPVQWK